MNGRWSWMQKLAAWYRLQKLKSEFRRSEQFQKACEEAGCVILADLEKAEQEKIRRQISRLKIEGG